MVTGAAELIGRWVAAELLGQENEVRGHVGLSCGSHEKVADLDRNDRFSLTVGDVRDRPILERLFDGDGEECIHLPAEKDVYESLEYPASHFETDVGGNYRVHEACRQSDTDDAIDRTCIV